MTLEERLRGAAANPRVDTAMHRVAALHRRRRVRRVAIQGGAVAAAFGAVIVGSAMAIRSNTDPQINVGVAPPTGSSFVPAAPTIAFETGSGDVREPLAVEQLLPTPGFSSIHAPIVMDGSGGMWVTATRSEASASAGESIIHVRPNRELVEYIDFQGSVRTLTSVKGIVFAVVEETVTGSEPKLRFKRVVPGTDRAEAAFRSQTLPSGVELVGEIVAEGGNVWIPVRDGLLRADVVTGSLEGKVELPAEPTRTLVPGPSGIWSSDGTDLVRIGQSELNILERVPMGGTVVAAGGIRGMVEGGPGTALGIADSNGEVRVVIWDPGYLDVGSEVTEPAGEPVVAGSEVGIFSDWTTGWSACSIDAGTQRCIIDDLRFALPNLVVTGIGDPVSVLRFGLQPADGKYPIVIASSDFVWNATLKIGGVF